MQTETTTPLWKVLNEKRTQGEFVSSPDGWPDCTIWSADGKECIATIWANDKTEFNARYAALAVNNLHILAEAINTALKSTSSNNNDKIEIEFEALQGLQSALARIS